LSQRQKTADFGHLSDNRHANTCLNATTSVEFGRKVTLKHLVMSVVSGVRSLSGHISPTPHWSDCPSTGPGGI